MCGELKAVWDFAITMTLSWILFVTDLFIFQPETLTGQ